MRCADHPKRMAVAMLHTEYYSIGVCSECFKDYKKGLNKIRWMKNE